MFDNKNFLIAIVLSVAVLIGWQYFFPPPQRELLREQQQQSEQLKQQQPTSQPAGTAPTGGGGAIPGSAPATAAAGAPASRDAALALSPRVTIETPRVSGSINLKGGRLDDLRLNDFHETVDKKSPTIILLSPTGTPITPGDPHKGVEGLGPYFAEFGWLGEGAGQAPGPDTLWTADPGARLTTTSPVTLTYDNGAGLVFKRTIAIDENYMFTVKDSVDNKTGAAVNLTPYGRVTRVGEVHTSGYFILHEGLIGVFGDEGLEEYTYKNLTKTPEFAAKPATDGWLGITSKYWATALIPEKGHTFDGRFTRSQPQAATGQPAADPQYQADFRSSPVSVPAGGSAQVSNMLFAGAKQVSVVGMDWLFLSVPGYNQRLGLHHFDLLIDWGWFYIITKPMFFLIDWFYQLLGNFGLAILAVTVCVKLVFFPLANKSYKSMSGMKKVQPQMQEIRERYKDDKMKQQQALMELYKKEKINPVSGCWPMVLQIPVFFSLYKVLFVTIEMRHAPFFGWIQDLSAPDPTHVFNLFGLLPYDPTVIPVIGGFLAIGIWPVIMGITMFVQMRLNPTPTDPAQQVIFTWMPVIFTFMLASFPAGLVIYWAWNNTLSVIQQYVIMRRQGVDVDLFGNILDTFRKQKKSRALAAAKAAALPAAANDDAAGEKADKPASKPKRGPKGKPREADAG